MKGKLIRWTLVLGVLQVTLGCAVGFIPPPAVAWFRGIVMAHIELTANGVLMVVLGLLAERGSLGPRALRAWFAALQLGTWTNGAAGLAGALIGASSKLLPTINEKFPAPRGLDHPIPTALLTVCGIAIMIALLLTLYGLVHGRTSLVTRSAT